MVEVASICLCRLHRLSSWCSGILFSIGIVVRLLSSRHFVILPQKALMVQVGVCEGWCLLGLFGRLIPLFSCNNSNNKAKPQKNSNYLIISASKPGFRGTSSKALETMKLSWLDAIPFFLFGLKSITWKLVLFIKHSSSTLEVFDFLLGVGGTRSSSYSNFFTLAKASLFIAMKSFFTNFRLFSSTLGASFFGLLIVSLADGVFDCVFCIFSAQVLLGVWRMFLLIVFIRFSSPPFAVWTESVENFALNGGVSRKDSQLKLSNSLYFLCFLISLPGN